MFPSRVRRPAWRLAMRAASTLHRAVYRASGGRLAGHLHGLPVLLLTTTGRRTGKRRTVPLFFVHDGEDAVVVASNGGMDWPPAWWLNLQQHPGGEVELGRRRYGVTASKADPKRRARLWPLLAERYPGYVRYEARTSREIPLVVLRRS